IVVHLKEDKFPFWQVTMKLLHNVHIHNSFTSYLAITAVFSSWTGVSIAVFNYTTSPLFIVLFGVPRSS
ncbi:MAG: hypothetical protein QXR63_06100, partial [Candidatus Bathyarchaeia archaeon]